MLKILEVLNFVCSIDEDRKKAGMIAGAILGGVIVICAFALIFKKILLNKKYHEDEKFVKEYREKLKEKEMVEQEQKNTGLIGDDF